MDIKKLKELAKKIGGVLVMDGNTPELVFLSYEKYLELEKAQQTLQEANQTPEPNLSVQDDQLIDKLNQEIASLKEEIRQKEEQEIISQEEVKPGEAQDFLNSVRQDAQEILE